MVRNKAIRLALVAIFACTIAVMSSAGNKLTPAAQLALLEKQVVCYDLNGQKKAKGQPAAIRLVVTVDADDAAGTFAQIREAGGKVLSKLGHQAVMDIPANKVNALAGIAGVKSVDATHKGELKTDVTRVETGVSLIDGSTTDLDETYTGRGVTICVIDKGVDFQHPAFKDANGNSRLRCVYLPSDDSGHKFIVEDEEAGTIEYPGSVFDTPELIATLTTDAEDKAHGTHTTGIAAGTRSPLGYGGMAPEADIVLVSLASEDNVIEIAFQFAAHYAQQIDGPVVVSASLNTQAGPHDGTGTILNMINELSEHAIPIFSVGNEGGQSIHIYKAFDEENNSMKALLAKAIPFITDTGISRMLSSVVYGYSRNKLSEDDVLTVRLGIVKSSNGEIVWQTEPCVISPSQEGMVELLCEEDEALSKYMEDGFMAIYGSVNDGKLELIAAAQGILKLRVPYIISISSSSPIEIDLWETNVGFDNAEIEGLTYGDSELSCGDWTCTPNVISVGNYVANTNSRHYTGVVDDFGLYALNEISWSSSYGVSFNGVAQPTVAAPGTNVVSSYSRYACDREIAESMQWQGFPYDALSGTSMSCPVVSGIVALWLQAAPTLTLTDIKDILAHTSRNDEYTAIDPIKWGYGKIDAAAGIEYINRVTGINGITCEDPSQGDSNVWYDITGRAYNVKPTAPGIYINAGKKVLITP